jgi:hypothetical protein
MRSLLFLFVGSVCGCSLVLDFGSDIESDDVIDGAPAGPDARTDCAETLTFYPDVDQDTFGDAADPVEACEAPPGYVSDSTDCDDGDELVHPGAADVCNGADDDCNDTADDGLCRIGCADGQREGFTALMTEPDIAGCAGGFALPGLVNAAAPACDRGAGDDGDLPGGAGCNASDLCGLGWHVCASPAQVAAASSTGTCTAAAPDGAPPLFFATRQSGTGGAECNGGANDLFGCGNVGNAVAASCAPLDRTSGDLCAALAAPWSCGNDNINEAANASKPGRAGGGVLCCRD